MNGWYSVMLTYSLAQLLVFDTAKLKTCVANRLRQCSASIIRYKFTIHFDEQ